MSAKQVPSPNVIEPRWAAATSPLDITDYTIDCAALAQDEAAMFDPDGPLATCMRATYEKSGLVLAVNTGLRELDAMRQLARHVMQREMDYTGGANPRNLIEPNVFDVGAPLSAWLHYHHEMAYVGHSTKMLAFLCRDALPQRGCTYLSDGVRSTDAILATEFGAKLRELGVCYHRHLTDREQFREREPLGVYNHWQQSMGTEDAGEARRIAEARGLQTEWGPDRLLKTRFYASAFEYFAPLDRNLLYCSVADHGVWFDAWPLVMHLPYTERPLDLTFGDDTPFSHEEIATFIDVYDQFGMAIDWRVGDVAVVCNYRFAHGRPAIHLQAGERRELGVMLGEQYPRIGAMPDKW